MSIRKSMKVAVYYSNKDIRIEKASVPEIKSGEILMKVVSSGICGSDIMEWYRKDKVPLVLGHEVSGTVEKIGRGVKGFKIGDHIVATHHVPCYKCEYCLKGHHSVCETLRTTKFYPGGFAEFVRIPKINVKSGVLKISKNVSSDDATFVEPLGCVLRGQNFAGTSKNKRVLVIGSGISGLLHIKVAKYFKAKAIISTDIDPFRLKQAKKYGADSVINAKEDVPKKVQECFKGKKAELVIICSGNPQAIAQGLNSVDRGGEVLVFTAADKEGRFPLSINELFWRTELKIFSSYAASYKDLKQALDLISKRKIIVKDMITHKFSLNDTQKGFALVCKPHRSMKVIINPANNCLYGARSMEHGKEFPCTKRHAPCF